jgi:hypothetical protein
VCERASKNERKCFRNFYLSFSSSFLFCVFAATVSFFYDEETKSSQTISNIAPHNFFSTSLYKATTKKTS